MRRQKRLGPEVPKAQYFRWSKKAPEHGAYMRIGGRNEEMIHRVGPHMGDGVYQLWSPSHPQGVRGKPINHWVRQTQQGIVIEGGEYLLVIMDRLSTEWRKVKLNENYTTILCLEEDAHAQMQETAAYVETGEGV